MCADGEQSARVPFEWNGALLRSQEGDNPSSAHKLARARAEINARAHIPLIHLAQNGPPPEGLEGEPPMEEEEPPFSPLGNNRLSTISEKTEQHTIDSRTWGGSQQTLRTGNGASQQHLAVPGRGSYYAPSRASGRPMSTFTTTTITDYGQVIGMYESFSGITSINVGFV